MTDGKLIALAWLTFAMFIVAWGGSWIHIVVPVLAVAPWLAGTIAILRRKKA